MLTAPISQIKADRDLTTRLVNLITGLELLSIGTSFHDFNKDGSNITRENAASIEKGYTLDLLFGDIFYSRAVIYLLKYRDYKVFDSILEALKKLHESRLKLHLIIQEALESGGDPQTINRDRRLLIDANRLLQISFMIGQSLPGNENPINQDEFKEIVDMLLLCKTYSELGEYVSTFPGTDSSETITAYLKKGMEDILNQTRRKLQDIDDINRKNTMNLFLNFLIKV